MLSAKQGNYIYRGTIFLSSGMTRSLFGYLTQDLPQLMPALYDYNRRLQHSKNGSVQRQIPRKKWREVL